VRDVEVACQQIFTSHLLMWISQVRDIRRPSATATDLVIHVVMHLVDLGLASSSWGQQGHHHGGEHKNKQECRLKNRSITEQSRRFLPGLQRCGNLSQGRAAEMVGIPPPVCRNATARFPHVVLSTKGISGDTGKINSNQTNPNGAAYCSHRIYLNSIKWISAIKHTQHYQVYHQNSFSHRGDMLIELYLPTDLQSTCAAYLLLLVIC
jgi:hypothetical protein